jgi:ceramide glucosyltransferase
MIELAIALACAGCLAAIETFVIGTQAWEHRRFAASRLRSGLLGQNGTVGRALVIIPCRGLEPNLKDNLRRFFRQDYGDFALRFVVESSEDPAVSVIHGLIAEHPHVSAELVVAGLARGEAQKIHNLRAATETIPNEVNYLVFADSDAAPTEHWLSSMLHRICNSRSVAVTGYRWFIPSTGRFHEAVVHALNGAYAMLMSGKTPNLIWGGSWAIRKKIFDDLDLRSAWKGKICDDLVVARELLKRGLHVEYEPACLVATACQSDLKSVFAFASRQFFLLRHILPRWWLTDLLIGHFPTIVFWVAFVALLIARDGLLTWVAATVVAVLYGLQWARAELRVAAVKTYFPDLASQPGFRRVFWIDRLLSPVIQLIGFLASLSGGLRKQIVWRGITYRIGKNGQIQISRPNNTAILVCGEQRDGCQETPAKTDVTGADHPKNRGGQHPVSLTEKQKPVAA